MRSLLAATLLAAPLLAGCATPPPDDGQGDAAADAPAAPWWPVGAWWDVTFTFRDRPPETARLVNFQNASDHFWLGVADRADALDHALHDTNPFLGRVHHVLLAPHEGNRHAIMYKFPLQRGEAYTSGNPFFGSMWNLVVEDAPGWRVVGTAPDGSTIRYDYDPATRWFRELEVLDPSGRPTLVAEVDAHGEGARGTYWFLRGRDYYEGPNGPGTHEETFEVKEEEKELAALAFELDVTWSGPMRIDVIDPAAQVRHTETTAGGAMREVVEIPAPARGTWTVRYVGTGAPEGRVVGIGLLEYGGTV